MISAAREARDLKSTIRELVRRRISADIRGGYRVKGGRRKLAEFCAWYNQDRCHLSLAKDAPEHRPVEPPVMGKVVALPRLGGLHHRYTRRAA